MRKLFQLTLAVLACSICVNRASASIVNIDFDDAGVAVSSGTNLIVGDLSSRGFLFDSFLDHQHRVNNAFALNNGTTWLGSDDYPPPGNPNKLTMSQVGGAAFQLFSLDLSGWVGAGHAQSVTLTGNQVGGGVLTATLVLNQPGSGPYTFQNFTLTGWTNLSNVVFRPNGGSDPENWWAMDNIRVDTVSEVPVPAGLALSGIGILCLAGHQFRRRFVMTKA